MVVGMLMSPEKQTLSPSVEEDGRNPAIAHHSDQHAVHPHAVHPHAVHHAAPAFPRSDAPGSSSVSGSSRMAGMNHGGRAGFSEERRATSTEPNITEIREGGDESRHDDKTTRLRKRKLPLTSSPSGSRGATEAQDGEDEDPESPPPAKRWVIGPIFQTFKSKMASFAEIVMSPARLFKPSEFPPGLIPDALENRDEDETDGKKGTFSGEKEKLTPLTKLEVVQRLRFDTDSDSERSKATGSREPSEPGGDFVSEGDGSFGSPRAISENTDVGSSVQNHESASVKKASGSRAARQKLIVLCEQMTTNELRKHSHGKQSEVPTSAQRLPTPAVGKRNGPERRELLVMVNGTEGTIGTQGAEESPTLTTVENPALVRTGKRRRVQVPGDSLMCNTADVQVSERPNNVPSRSRSKRFASTNGTDDSTPLEGPPASVTWTSSRVTRQRKNREHEKSADPAERVISSDRTSGSKRVRKSDLGQTRHKSKADSFVERGMSMSLTLKVGSGVDQRLETRRKRKLKGKNAVEEQEAMRDASCPSGKAPEDLVGAEDDRFVDDGRPEKKKCFVRLNRGVKHDSVAQEDSCLASIRCSTNPLKRSVSCPDISLRQGIPDFTPSAPDGKTFSYPPSPLKKVPPNAPSPLKRTRRHTVCSLEIEREIAPLCLRKEVYPAWGTASSRPHPHSPLKSLASLISRFLTSPQAFRSKSSSRGVSDDSGYAASGSDLGIASSSSPSPVSLRSPAFPSATDEFTFFSDAPQRPGKTPVSSQCSGFNSVSVEAEEAVIQQRTEGNQRSSEEKALSDSSRLTPDDKQVERRKVSSIRIRKTLPKAQYNLTPMGLPKAVRIKKKVFSVEEIYTNKNFTKPPEGRLETIFEVPLSRRDGSQALIGPKRMKRFIEFPELGVARKLRRPLVGGAGGGGAPRKSSANSGAGRTRRGREEGAVHVQDFDSLLCSKLDELDLWMATENLVY